jgi:hypothetical protein
MGEVVGGRGRIVDDAATSGVSTHQDGGKGANYGINFNRETGKRRGRTTPHGGRNGPVEGGGRSWFRRIKRKMWQRIFWRKT